MSKPIGLITANVIHEAADQVARLPEPLAELARDAANLNSAIARELLCTISHDAALPVVLRALAAVDAPATLEEIAARMTAARELQAKDNGEGIAASLGKESQEGQPS